MKAGIDERPAGRLQSMFGKEQPTPYAVPLNRDAYQIALDHIDPDPRQPRKTFDDAELQHLAQTIRESGLLQPIVVYRTEDPTRYRIIAGERRYRAAKLAGLSAVPCLEMPADFDTALVDQLQLLENFQRADLHPLEAAAALETYIARHSLSQRQAARRLGKPLAFIAELLAIQKIPSDLLSREGVSNLPKQTLVEIARAPAGERESLLQRALSGSSLDNIRTQRSNRNSHTRVVYFRERFLLDGQPPIDLHWKKHPEDVTDGDLIDVLGAVIREIASRRHR
jgi:ParB family chromosome partitioning protein